jgi:tetratricopeptide (TPR) repeat protein
MGASPWEETIPQAKQAVAKALSLDDSSAEAHQAAAFIHYLEWDWKGAEEETKKSIALNPNFSTVYVVECNILRHFGRVEESIAAAKRGLEVDPLAMITNQMLGNAYVNARRYDLAIAQYQKALELHPNDSTLLHHLGWAYLYNQQPTKVCTAMESSSKLEGRRALDPYQLTYACGNHGPKRRRNLVLLLELAEVSAQHGLITLVYVGLDGRGVPPWLEKAYQRHSPMTVFSSRSTNAGRIRREPGFQVCVARTDPRSSLCFAQVRVVALSPSGSTAAEAANRSFDQGQ